MRRSFSHELEEDREFEIGGEVFRFVYPHWKDGAKFFDADLERLKASQEGGNEANGEFSFVADTEKAIKGTLMFLDPDFNDAHSRWKALVDRVPRHQIIQVYRWLVEITGGFPTKPPLDSSPSDGTSDTPSAEGES
jgi:hypothetical protein